MENNLFVKDNDSEFLVREFFKYLSFWPFYLITIILSITISFLFIRYADYKYETIAKIEVLDKSQDSEMALPTSMTIFNRSMINLENEIGILTSYTLHEKVVKELNSNINYYSIGNIKTNQKHSSEWFDDYDLNFKIDTDTLKVTYTNVIETFEDGKFSVEVYKNDEFVNVYNFENGTSKGLNHDMLFDLTFNKFQPNQKRVLKLKDLNSSVNYFKGLTKISEIGQDSDLLKISIISPNKKIAQEYINKLLFEFDLDGIRDRQLEYKRTMDFVDSRSSFIVSELDKIENRKLVFKQKNNLSSVDIDVQSNSLNLSNYENELFRAESQRELSYLLESSVKEKKYEFLPLNIGVENENINSIIAEFNLLVKERDILLSSAGKSNFLVKNIENQLDKYYENILLSIENFQQNLETQIKNIELKESEFKNLFKNVPVNEKILRSINRELNVKEALFLLLLQKREEASINFAVVKPSIKIIDSARAAVLPISPVPLKIYLIGLLSSILIPSIILLIIFLIDNKIHTKEQLSELISNKMPIIGEVPHIKDLSLQLIDSNTRNPLAESIRMLIANLNYSVISDNIVPNKATVILVTSSVKGEGKTLISANVSSALSMNNKKVLLIGADLRNPQIHKIIGLQKSQYGLSDMLYKDEISNFKKYTVTKNNFDILLSGTIPPNPTELLSSEKFKDFINEAKKEYDYIIIDSAPCVLVSDTISLAEVVDKTIYVVRANFARTDLVNFILDCKNQNKLKNINLVLNSVGSRSIYGYEYNYRYGYKYGYNYGYKYGYSDDSTTN